MRLSGLFPVQHEQQHLVEVPGVGTHRGAVTNDREKGKRLFVVDCVALCCRYLDMPKRYNPPPYDIMIPKTTCCDIKNSSGSRKNRRCHYSLAGTKGKHGGEFNARKDKRAYAACWTTG